MSKSAAMEIAILQPEHWPAVKRIYEQGITTGNATFETTAPAWEQWDRGHLSHSRLVALDNGQVIGWVALSPVSGRCVYAGVAEVSVYIAPDHWGKKLGKTLLNAVIDASEENGIWTLNAGIFRENAASIKIHQDCGFRLIGYRERVGQMNGHWRDTLQFERRSKVVGV